MQLYEPSQLIFLWSLPLLLALFGWGEWEWRRRLARLGKADFLQSRLMPGFSRAKRRAGWALLLGVFFLATLALARPQWGEEKKKIERKGVDLIFLLDTSLSMLAEDVKPSRLGKSKLEIKNIIRRLKGDRVGMIGFAGSSFLQCPLTLDYGAFLLFIDAIKTGYIPDPGTSLSRAIELGLRAFPEKSRKYKAILVFSDGEDHEGGVSEAVAAAKKAGVRIYTVGVGTAEGEPIPLRSAESEKITGYKKDREGQVVVTRLNAPLLTEIAKETGGLYLPATASEREIDIILKHLETLGERQLKERLITEREDHFQLFLLLAFLLLIGETLFGSRMGRAAKVALPILCLVLFTGFLDTPRSLVNKGNRLTEEKKYQSAVENYRKAEVAHPNEPVIRYNLGTTLYHLYEYRDAEKELEQALGQAKDPATKAQILYNYGNAKYRLGDFEKAIEAYKKVLDINPKDEDAKYNLEFLQKKKSEFEKKNEERQKEQPQKQPQQQQQQQQQQPQPRDQQQEQQQQQQEQQEQQQQQQQQQEQQRQEQQQQQQQQKQEQQAQAEPQPERGEEEKEQQPAGGVGAEEKEEQQKEEEKQEQGREEKKEERKDEGDQGQEPKPETGEREEERPGQEGERPEEMPAQVGGARPLQGQMSPESARRLLDALHEGEKELQDLRRPPVPPTPREVYKDW